MNYKRLKSGLIVVSFIAICIISCNKKLDVKPIESIDAANAITTAADVESALIGCYSIMAGPQLYGTSLLMDGDLLASSSYCSFVGTFNQFRQVSGRTLNRENTEIARVWRRAYQTINMANIVLESSSIVTNPADKSTIEGEALLIRALMHFELVRFYALPWGATANNDHLGVIIATKAVKNEKDASVSKPRSTVAQVYAAIISDIDAALNKLPSDNGVRLDRFAAFAIKARVLMQQGLYNQALSSAHQVITSGKYKMNPSVSVVFDNKNSAESIFEIQQNDQNNAGQTNDGMATFYASLAGGIGRGDVRVSSTYLGLYPAGDFRRTEWYYVGVGARPGGNNCSKWKSFSQNLPIIRIAEMYLVRAECNARLGTSVGATPESDLAQIRNPLRTNLPVISNPSLSDILQERYLELGFEGARIHDVKRLQISNGSFAWNSNRLVFPIPQREVDASGGVIVQNPGY